jgi:hypothetical protein
MGGGDAVGVGWGDEGGGVVTVAVTGWQALVLAKTDVTAERFPAES